MRTAAGSWDQAPVADGKSIQQAVERAQAELPRWNHRPITPGDTFRSGLLRPGCRGNAGPLPQPGSGLDGATLGESTVKIENGQYLDHLVKNHPVPRGQPQTKKLAAPYMLQRNIILQYLQ